MTGREPKRFAGFSAFSVCMAVLVAAAGLASIVAFNQYLDRAAKRLALVEDHVRDRYPGLSHVAPSEFEAVRSSDPDLLIFDVRTEPEYKVSHIAGARRVDPDMSAAAFLAQVGDVRGKRVAFYCSVGMRSSTFAARVREGLEARGAIAIKNVSGGVFRWHNEARQLERAGRVTDAVHPYDAKWSLFLSRRELAQTDPQMWSAANQPRGN